MSWSKLITLLTLIRVILHSLHGTVFHTWVAREDIALQNASSLCSLSGAESNISQDDMEGISVPYYKLLQSDGL